MADKNKQAQYDTGTFTYFINLQRVTHSSVLGSRPPTLIQLGVLFIWAFSAARN
jgi:hypothetical protein